jgi:hypothetical protein
VWYELLEETVGHGPDEIAPGNRWSAVILLHDLIGIGLRNGAVRPTVIHSSGPGSYAHLMFRYTLDAEFDWSGEIQLMLDRGVPAIQTDLLITEVEAATGIAEHEDDE